MTIKLNLDRVEHRPTDTGGDFDTSVQAAPLHGSVTGQIAVGRYVVQIGDACGALIGEASQVEQPQCTLGLRQLFFVRSRLGGCSIAGWN